MQALKLSDEAVAAMVMDMVKLYFSGDRCQPTGPGPSQIAEQIEIMHDALVEKRLIAR